MDLRRIALLISFCVAVVPGSALGGQDPPPADQTQPAEGTGPKELWTSQMQAGAGAYKEQRWSDAEASFQGAVKAAEDFGPLDPIVAVTLYYLASTQDKLGRVSDAEAVLRRALDIFDAQSGIADPELAQLYGLTMNDLAVIEVRRAGSATPSSSRQGLLDEAERLLQRALALRAKVDPGEVGRTLSNLTQVYVDSGRWGEAAGTAERAASFYERQRGPEDEEVVYQLDRLADIYIQEGRGAEAEPVIKRVMSSMQRRLGPNDPAIATRLESYAAALRKADREADARALEAQAGKIRSNAPTPP